MKLHKCFLAKLVAASLLVGLYLPLAKAGDVSIRLSTAELEEMYWAAYLSEVVYYRDWVKDHQDDMSNYNDVSLDLLDYWKNEADASMVAKVTDINVCFGVFRGTDVVSASDWLQNADTGARNVHGCKVRSGWYKPYDNSYKSNFDSSLAQCLQDCPDCKLILTGHSQGAAVAQVASLVYRAKNPVVVTFGGPKVIYAPCKYIDSNRHYRFINVNNYESGNYYDGVTMITGFGAEHFGKPILLGTQVKASALRTNDNKKRVAYVFSSHLVHNYVDRIKKVLETHQASTTSHFTIGRRGNGKRCGYSDECSSGRCEGALPPYHCRPKLKTLESCNEPSDCLSGKCQLRSTLMVCALSNGKMPNNGPCDIGSHCDSGRCEGSFPPYRCRSRLGTLSTCNESSDCQSNKCLLRSTKMVCALSNGKIPDGGPCDVGSNCVSGRCEGSWPPYKCHAKLRKGKKCNENSDCKSNKCKWLKCK